MIVSIDKLRGMDVDLLVKLAAQGIHNSRQLLEAARTPAERRDLADRAGVESRVILELANRADLARVGGVGAVFSNLLEHAGVDTATELAARNPDNLHAKIVEVNAEHQLAGRTPSRPVVASWVTQAKELPKIIEY